MDAARTLLAWEDINDDTDAVGQLEESQKRTLTQSFGRARADLREAIWRAYRHVFFLKVLATFVSSSGLTLQVGFDAPADGENAQATGEEINSAWRDVGLDEEATLS